MNAIGAEPNNWDKHFKLMADLDLQGVTLNPIGVCSTDEEDRVPFTGVFDGNGRTISNFRASDTGLFEYVSGYVPGLDYIVTGVEIRNLTLIDPNVHGSRATSLVSVLNHGTVKGCSLWFRAGPIASTSNDSFWVRIKDATIQPTGNAANPGWVKANNLYNQGDTAVWRWFAVWDDDHGDGVVQFTLPAGTHTLEVACRCRYAVSQTSGLSDIAPKYPGNGREGLYMQGPIPTWYGPSFCAPGMAQHSWNDLYSRRRAGQAADRILSLIDLRQSDGALQ